MKAKKLVLICLVASCFCFIGFIQSEKIKKPRIYINNFKTEVPEGTLINCRKIESLGAIVYLNKDMQKYDNFQIELHRFGTDGDAMVAYQNFTPSNKDFQKKFRNKDSLKVDMINPTDVNNSDFVTNTLLFKIKGITIENIFCTIHELQHCNFYVVIKGYSKTGKTNQFGEEEFDSGVEISERSITFRNWEKK